MENNALTLVLKNDWVASSSGNTYTGKYTVGRFHLTDAFIVVYMKLIHGIEIPDLWVSSSFTGLAPIFPYTFYHLTHYWFAAADIPV
ncbi:hypothetical protein SJ973_16205, partial [Citrobacter freundii]|nr:hypothetical protein [Citrobacter freundii]